MTGNFPTHTTQTPSCLYSMLNPIQYPLHRHGVELFTGAGALALFVETVSNSGEAEAFVLAQEANVAYQFLVSNNGRFPLHPRPLQLRFVGQVVGPALWRRRVRFCRQIPQKYAKFQSFMAHNKA